MVIDKKKVLKTIVPAIAGGVIGVGALAVYERVKTGWWPWEKEPEPEDDSEFDGEEDWAEPLSAESIGKLYPLVEYRNDEEDTIGDSELAHKPNIFLFETEVDKEELEKANPELNEFVRERLGEWVTGKVITQEQFMNIPAKNQHVATWFIDDEIFAGLDDALDELDPMEICGGIGEDAMLTLKSGTVSGLYVMCGDGETGLEIIVSHGNYLEEYEAIQEILAADIADSEGYSQQGADEVVISRTSRRR